MIAMDINIFWQGILMIRTNYFLAHLVTRWAFAITLLIHLSFLPSLRPFVNYFVLALVTPLKLLHKVYSHESSKTVGSQTYQCSPMHDAINREEYTLLVWWKSFRQNILWLNQSIKLIIALYLHFKCNAWMSDSINRHHHQTCILQKVGFTVLQAQNSIRPSHLGVY